MRKKMEWQWEQLDESSYRAKVIGGWILLHTKHTTIVDSKKNKDMIQTESMVFIPDRDHEWTITPILKEPEAPKPTVKADDFAPSK